MEEVLGAHVDDNAALTKSIQQVGIYRERESQLLSSHLPLPMLSAIGWPAYWARRVSSLWSGYSGYVWYRRRPRAEHLTLPLIGSARIGSP